MTKRILSVFLAALLAFGSLAATAFATGDYETVVAPSPKLHAQSDGNEDLTITVDRTMIKVGETLNVIATGNLINSTINGVIYTSGNSDVAIAKQANNRVDGLVIGVAPGTVQIIASVTDPKTSTDVTATLLIDVIKMDDITFSSQFNYDVTKKIYTVDKNDFDNAVDKSAFIASCNVIDQNGSEQDVTWTSSDQNILRIDSKTGEIELIGLGNVTITATYNKNPNISTSQVVRVWGLLVPASAMAKDGKIYAHIGDEGVEFTPEYAYEDGTVGANYRYTVLPGDPPAGSTHNDNDKVNYVDYASGSTSIAFRSISQPGTYHFDITVLDGDNPVDHATVTVVFVNLDFREDTVYLQKGDTKRLGTADSDIKGINITPDYLEGTWTGAAANPAAPTQQIITVDSKTGVIHAISEGKAVITYTCGSVSKSFNLSVISGSFKEKTIYMAVGDKTQVTYIVREDTDLFNPEGTVFSPSAGNSNVVEVDEKGVVTALKGGTEKVGADFNGAKNYCNVTVYNIDLPKTAYVPLDGTRKTSEMGISVPTGSSKWTTSDKDTVAVNAFGDLTGKKLGSAEITYEINGIKKSYTAKVFKMYTALEQCFVPVDGSYEMKITIDDGSGKTIVNPEGTVWTTENKDVVKVDEKGKITGLKTGEETVTATFCGKSISMLVYVISTGTITVTDSKDALVLGDLYVGKEYKVTVTVVLPDGFSATKLSVPGFAADGAGNFVAKIIPTQVAKYTVSAMVYYDGKAIMSLSSVYDVADISITNTNNQSISSLAFTKNSGSNIKVVYNTTGTTKQTIEYKTSAPDVVLIKALADDVYQIVGRKAGNTVITFTAGGIERSISVTVIGIPVTGLNINAPQTEFAASDRGKDFIFSYTFTPLDADIGSATWTSSDTSVATVDPLTGKVHIIKAGTATINLTVIDATGKTTVASKQITVKMTWIERIIDFFKKIASVLLSFVGITIK